MELLELVNGFDGVVFLWNGSDGVVFLWNGFDGVVFCETVLIKLFFCRTVLMELIFCFFMEFGDNFQPLKIFAKTLYESRSLFSVKIPSQMFDWVLKTPLQLDVIIFKIISEKSLTLRRNLIGLLMRRSHVITLTGYYILSKIAINTLLYVLIMSRTHFRVNPHSIVA